jgi:hypothetical protein
MLADARDWVDPRGPDGFTILAPYEQAKPGQHPGAPGGAPSKAMMLFDLEDDPSEQRDVAAGHPDVVSRLTEAYDRLNQEVEKRTPPSRRAGQRLMRLKGGELRYDREASPPK